MGEASPGNRACAAPCGVPIRPLRIVTGRKDPAHRARGLGPIAEKPPLGIPKPSVSARHSHQRWPTLGEGAERWAPGAYSVGLGPETTVLPLPRCVENFCEACRDTDGAPDRTGRPFRRGSTGKGSQSTSFNPAGRPNNPLGLVAFGPPRGKLQSPSLGGGKGPGSKNRGPPGPVLDLPEGTIFYCTE